MTAERTNNNCIVQFMHCGLCLSEKPSSISPQEYSQVSVGWTVAGLQVWCDRHACNVLHVDFEGHKHPADTTRQRRKGEGNGT